MKDTTATENAEKQIQLVSLKKKLELRRQWIYVLNIVECLELIERQC